MSTEVSANYIKAKELDRRIKTSAQLAQQSLYDMCIGFKEMRDGKLYEELGYQNFEEYCENETGVSIRSVYRYISIVENLPENFVTPVSQIGVVKLYLLSTLSEEERTEITESTDLETVSKRELEEKIKEIRSLNTKLDTAENEKESLKTELEQINRERESLYEQVKELEARPIDITVCESDSREIANMKEAMKICDNQWAEKYNELQESTIIQNRQIHQEYKEKIDKLTAEYEHKLTEMPVQSEKQISVPDMKETFKLYYSMVYKAYETLVSFVQKQKPEDRDFCCEKAKLLLENLGKMGM